MLCVVRDRPTWIDGHRFEVLVVVLSSPLVPLALALAPADIDTHAGPGFCWVDDTGQFVLGSALIAMQVSPSFTHRWPSGSMSGHQADGSTSACTTTRRQGGVSA
jgi:hypothetical protein